MLKRQSNSSLSKRTHGALISKDVPEMDFESTEILSLLKQQGGCEWFSTDTLNQYLFCKLFWYLYPQFNGKCSLLELRIQQERKKEEFSSNESFDRSPKHQCICGKKVRIRSFLSCKFYAICKKTDRNSESISHW